MSVSAIQSPLSPADALTAFAHADYDTLYAAAAAVRDTHWGHTLTYSRKVFIPLTNMCRNSCGYCAFVKAPDSPEAHIMTADEVLSVARAGAAAGCKEALFSLGERPERSFDRVRRWLDDNGYATMHDYTAAMCRLVSDETGLLPHVNIGTLTADEITVLRPVTASMGMMLESTSDRLLRPGMPHHRCPDKVPRKRLRTLTLAGEQQVPMTTGMLIGIGETWDERIETIQAIADVHRRYGHIQEVIVQNFRAKTTIAMHAHPEPDKDDMRLTLALARLLLPVEVSVQAPPNLQEAFGDYIGCGLNDWGGVSPVTRDHINPERAWPTITRMAEVCKRYGYELAERLTVYGRFVNERFVDATMLSRVRALAVAVYGR